MSWDRAMIPYTFCRGPASRLDDQEFRALVAMWCMAGRSPVRGSLMLTGEIPLSPGDVAREAPTSERAVESAIAKLVELGELERADEVLRFTKWAEINPAPRPSDSREARAARKRAQRARDREDRAQAELEGRSPQLVITERSSAPLRVIEDVFPTAPKGGRQRDRDRFIAQATDWLIDHGLGYVPVPVAEHAATHTDRPATADMLAAHPFVIAGTPRSEATG